ncbi:MAG: DUF3995 domain-containing protein [Longimicrobiaceae bacterium]
MPASHLVALVLAAVFTALAALHVYWALAGGAGAATVPTRADGTLLFRPSPGGTLAVAGALLAAAAVVLGRGGVAALPIPPALFRVGAWGLGAVLGLRAVGDFRYVGLFKRERRSAFARRDTALYSPLCAALAAGVFYLAAA